MNKYGNSQKFRKKIVILISVSVVLITTIAITFNIGFYKIHDKLLKKDMDQIELTSEYVVELVYAKIKNLLDTLETISQKTFVYTEDNEKEVAEDLEKIKEVVKFKKVGVTNLGGVSIDDTGKRELIKNAEFIDSIKSNHVYISDVVNVSDAIFMAVPIVQEGKAKGAIWGYFFISEIAEEIELSTDSHIYFQIIDNKGNYISDSNNKYAFAGVMNLWDELKLYQISHGVTVENIKSNVDQEKTGYFHFNYHGQGRHVVYKPLGINNWYIFSVMVEEYLDNSVEDIERIFFVSVVIVLGAVLIVVGLSGYYIYGYMKVIRTQTEQLEAKNTLLFMVLEQTKDLPFEIHFSEKTVTLYSYTNPGKIWVRTLEEYTPEHMIRENKIIPEEYKIYNEFYQNVLARKKTEDIILKINLGVRWEYKRIHIEAISQEYMIGFLENYTEYVIQTQKLKEVNNKAQTDPLTGLYRREYFVQKMEQIMQKLLLKQKRPYCALFLLDLDYFKKANDTLGHAVGDRILTDTGKKLKSILREGDLTGRLGGDEFVVFIQNARDISSFFKCAEKINATLRCTYGDEKKVTISVSIGIAVWDCEKDFTELYKKADAALYKAKEQGRNGYYLTGKEAGSEKI